MKLYTQAEAAEKFSLKGKKFYACEEHLDLIKETGLEFEMLKGYENHK